MSYDEEITLVYSGKIIYSYQLQRIEMYDEYGDLFFVIDNVKQNDVLFTERVFFFSTENGGYYYAMGDTLFWDGERYIIDLVGE
jgi:hypothetical protein